MTTIYGLRQIGSTEIRYVGQTQFLEQRLRQHRLKARWGYPARLASWITEVGAQIELVPLAECDDANRFVVERGIVEALIATGHRLMNGHLVPRGALNASLLSPTIAKARQGQAA